MRLSPSAIPAVSVTRLNDFRLLGENAGFLSSPSQAARILLLT